MYKNLKFYDSTKMNALSNVQTFDGQVICWKTGCSINLSFLPSKERQPCRNYLEEIIAYGMKSGLHQEMPTVGKFWVFNNF